MSVDGLLGWDRHGSARLDSRDLAILGHYLFGPRWKAALARELEVSDRIVKYWASAERPTSVRCSTMILALVQHRRASRLAAVQKGYAAMVGALTARPAALAITTEVVPPYLVPVEKRRLETVAEHYEEIGMVAIAAALRTPAVIVGLAISLVELI